MLLRPLPPSGLNSVFAPNTEWLHIYFELVYIVYIVFTSVFTDFTVFTVLRSREKNYMCTTAN